MSLTIDITKVDNVVMDDVDIKDFPDLCDAFIVSADYDGVPMTEEQLDFLNENFPCFVHEKAHEHLQG